MVYKNDYRLMLVKSIAECYDFLTFINLPFVFKTFLSFLSGRLGFTVNKFTDMALILINFDVYKVLD